MDPTPPGAPETPSPLAPPADAPAGPLDAAAALVPSGLDPAPPDAAPAAAHPPPAKSGAAFFAVLLALFVPGLVAQWLHPAAGLIWSELFVFLLPALVAAAGANLVPARYLGLSATRLPPVTLAVLVGVAGYLAANGVMALWMKALPPELVDAFDVGRIFDAPRSEQLLLAFAASVVAPFCEEVAFRGYLQRTFALRHRPTAAIGLAATLFAALHLDPVRFPALLLLGAIFGWLAFRAGSTWPAVVAHAVNNTLASGLLLSGAVPEDGRAPSTADALRVLLWGAGALALLLLAYRRATPAPPAPTDAILRRHPAVSSVRFGAARVPAGLHLAAAAGVVLLAAIALLGGR